MTAFANVNRSKHKDHLMPSQGINFVQSLFWETQRRIQWPSFCRRQNPRLLTEVAAVGGGGKSKPKPQRLKAAQGCTKGRGASSPKFKRKKLNNPTRSFQRKELSQLLLLLKVSWGGGACLLAQAALERRVSRRFFCSWRLRSLLILREPRCSVPGLCICVSADPAGRRRWTLSASQSGKWCYIGAQT